MTFRMQVDVMDCLGCGNCVDVCPGNPKKGGKALSMVHLESQLGEAANWEYCVENVKTKQHLIDIKANVKNSQFATPLFEFSGACSGCGETPYVKLISQLFGDREMVANATGCSSIYSGSVPSTPYTKNEKGHGPAWANSLFEDNAEHGFGMYLGQKAVRDQLIEKVRDVVENGSNEAVKAAGQKYLDTVNDGKANQAASEELIAALEACGCDKAKEILSQKEYLSKKSIWIFGGDGWAYDIGFGGVDHVLASGEDVNIMVFDTEVYSNTGGQASKASQIGQVAQFAAAGKAIAKKSLAEIAMSYGYIYVAQIAMGADMNQTIKAIAEAEAYPGPSLIIGYAPCEMHSIKGGMTNCQAEMKRAVDCGYWNMFRFNPALKAEGKNPFIMDSKEPTTDYKEFIMGEARYSSLTRAFPERAEELFNQAAQNAKDRYEHLLRLGDLYAAK